jgi:hypothetical protein
MMVEKYHYGQWSITNSYGYVDKYGEYCTISNAAAEQHGDNYDVFHAVKTLEINRGKYDITKFDDKIICGKCE